MSGSPAHEIGIVHYPGAQVACILGLTDLFGIASTIALDQRRSGQSPLRVTHWQPLHSRDANLSCVYDSAPRGSPKPRTLIIPPTMVDLPDPEPPAGVVSWVRNRHAAGATLVSLCSGAFLSWVDVGLFLVDRILGPAMRAETARFVLSDPAAGEARYFAGFAPPQTHRDRAVLKAQEWVHMRDGQGVSLAAMATAAGLERRTLLRRFASATGMTPIKYCRAVRIARARELLEGGDTSQKQIAQSLGYEDVASFARVFRKAVGSAPGAYRKRFGRNGISPADFAEKDGSRQKKHIFEAGLRTG
jgi:transcriptional regulator GlxA family with amidase domain